MAGGELADLVPYLDPELVGPLLGLESSVATQLAPREPGPLIRRRDAEVTLPDGGTVGVRTYEPSARSDLLPAALYVHGGGFVRGNVDMYDALCEETALACELVVASVEYRLAPQHPFPAAVDDTYAALKWLFDSAGELELDPSRIAIVGSSAGGCIAAGTALMARDRGELALAFQMLLCACLDDRHTTASSREIVDPRVFNRERSLEGWAAYLGGAEPVAYAAPARAVDLAGLPPAYLAFGQLDLIRDENLDYAGRLIAAGIPTELHVYPGAFHGFDHGIAPEARVSLAAVADRHGALRRVLHPVTNSARSSG